MEPKLEQPREFLFAGTDAAGVLVLRNKGRRLNPG